MAKKRIKTQKKILKRVVKRPDIPVTQVQFTAFSTEIRSLLTGQQLEMHAIEKRSDVKFEALEAKFAKLDVKFAGIDAKIENLATLVHRTNTLVEEQNSRNIYVLDAIRSVVDAQEDLRLRVGKLEKVTFGIES